MAAPFLTPQQVTLKNSTNAGAPYSLSYLNSMGNPQLSNPANYNPNLAQHPQPTGADTSGTYGTGGTGGTGGSSVATSPPIDQAALAQYDQQIGNVNAGIGRLGGQLNVGNQNIDTAYNAALNPLLQQKADTQTQYQGNKASDLQGYVSNKNTIGTNAGNSLNSLLRLLGAHGAGGSSVAQFNAPTAVAQQAAQQRSGAGQTFGKNEQGLDTSWNNFLRDEQNSEASLSRQRTDQRNSLQSKIDSTRASLLQNLATLQGQRAQVAGGNPVSAAQPYLDQANSLLSQADQLGANSPVYQSAPVSYQVPSLSQYVDNPFAAGQTSNTGALGDATTPFLSMLLGRKDQQQNPQQLFGF